MIRTAFALFLVALSTHGQSITNHIGVVNLTAFTYAFMTNGVSSIHNPTLPLKAGIANYFVVTNASIHPVVICTNSTTTGLYNGAAPQPTSSGTIALNTPASGFPTRLYYVCQVHGFSGAIDLTALVGPTPPPNTILSLQVGTNVVMLSTGTNTTWTVIPEFRSNLTTAVWTPVGNYTNTFSNGTNKTVFNRLDPICGPNVYLRLRQKSN
jgi:hypothetical protein